MTARPEGVLLDTCAVIWLANGGAMASAAMVAITTAALAQSVHVSPISAWEIGLLSRPRPDKTPEVQFLPDPKTWFARFMTGPGIRPADFTPGIAIDASHLPGELHGDPADRLIIATARHHGLPIVTRDRKIIAYGERGFVSVVPC